MSEPQSSPHRDQTLSSALLAAEEAGESALALTILWHPDWRRGGQQALLPAPGETLLLNRFTPTFGEPPFDEAGSLAHACVSRSPLTFKVCANGAVEVSAPSGRMACEIDGVGAPELTMLSAAQVAAGVVLQLGRQVALCLHPITVLPERVTGSSLIGVSSAMARVRRQVAQVAQTDLSVLVLGESGTGKELVAREIHQHSARASGAMVSVNMAAMTDSLAVADLFGAVRGAYTGAQTNRKGLFAEAEGGTLFLDEIGDTAVTVQPMLLRAIETGEIRPVGSSRSERANVRFIAATDRDLSASNFNQPLLRRLEAFVIRMPALRERREDIGVLLRSIWQELAREPGSAPVSTADIPPALIGAMCLHDWPGNVRQLGHAARRLVLASKTGDWPTVTELLGKAAQLPSVPASQVNARVTHEEAKAPDRPLDPPAPVEDPPAQRAGYKRPSSIAPDAVLAALHDSGWCLRTAAQRLEISRPSLYNLIARHPSVRRLDDISNEELVAALASGSQGADQPADVAQLARQLHTPRDALLRRLRAMGMAPSKG